MSDVQPTEIYDEAGGRGDYIMGLIAGAIIGVAAGAIFTGIASRKAPCNCHDQADPLDAGVTYVEHDYTSPVPAAPAAPAVAHANGHQAPAEFVMVDDTPLPPPTATKGPASPSRAPFPGVMRPGSPVAGPWGGRNGHGNN